MAGAAAGPISIPSRIPIPCTGTRSSRRTLALPIPTTGIQTQSQSPNPNRRCQQQRRRRHDEVCPNRKPNLCQHVRLPLSAPPGVPPLPPSTPPLLPLPLQLPLPLPLPPLPPLPPTTSLRTRMTASSKSSTRRWRKPQTRWKRGNSWRTSTLTTARPAGADDTTKSCSRACRVPLLPRHQHRPTAASLARDQLHRARQYPDRQIRLPPPPLPPPPPRD